MRRLLLAVPAAALVLAACEPFHAGAAATVGDTRIATSQLRTIVERGLAAVPPQASPPDRTALERQTLTKLIQQRLLGSLADTLHVAVSDQQVSAAISQAGQGRGQQAVVQSAAQSAVAEPDIPLYFRVSLLQQAVLGAIPIDQAAVRAAYDKTPHEQVHVAHILVDSKALAQQILAKVRKNPASFAALAEQYSTDQGSKAQGGDLGFASRGQYVQPFEQAAFAGKDGTIVGPVQTQFGYHIIKIIKHRTETLAQAEQALRPQLAQSAFLAAYTRAERSLGVHVSPRFGTWVPQTQQNPLGEVGAGGGDLSVPAGGAAGSAAPVVPGASAPPQQ